MEISDIAVRGLAHPVCEREGRQLSEFAYCIIVQFPPHTMHLPISFVLLRRLAYEKDTQVCQRLSISDVPLCFPQN